MYQTVEEREANYGVEVHLGNREGGGMSTTAKYMRNRAVVEEGLQELSGSNEKKNI